MNLDTLSSDSSEEEIRDTGRSFQSLIVWGKKLYIYSGPIVTKFYLKHYWVGGKKALGFGPDRIRTLVSMATDSSHRVIMGKML